MSSAPAGWYPQADGSQRYWDGERWTQHVAPPATPNQGQPQNFDSPRPTGGPEKPWYQKMWFVLPVVFVGLLAIVFVVVNVVGRDAETTTTNSAPSDPTASTHSQQQTEEPQEPESPTIGTPVRDGALEFVVTDSRCGIKSIGNKTLSVEAQGEFCQVSLTAKNIGDESQTLFASEQDASDAEGRKYSYSIEASVYDPDSDAMIMEELSPGETFTGKVYYDVPLGTQLAKIELHESVLSDGVEVVLAPSRP